jgi:hypothetical protein
VTKRKAAARIPTQQWTSAATPRIATSGCTLCEDRHTAMHTSVRAWVTATDVAGTSAASAPVHFTPLA